MKDLWRSRVFAALGMSLAVLAGGCERFQKFQAWRDMKVAEDKQAAATTKPATFSDEPEVKTTEVRAPNAVKAGTARKSIDLNPAVSRPRGSIEAAVLMINRDALTADEVLRRASPELESTAMTYGEDVYRRRAEDILSSTIRDLISETLLYQEIAARITEEQNPIVEKAVDKEINNYTTLEAGGSKVVLEKMLAQRGLSMEDLKKQLRKQIVTQQYLREKMKSKVIVTRDELWDYYQAHRSDFSEPASVHLLLIEVDAATHLPKGVEWGLTREENRTKAMAKARGIIETARARLAKGEDFAAVAKALAAENAARIGGDMGWISRGSYRARALEEAAFSLNVGAVGGPVVVDSKLYLLKVAEYHPEKTLMFTEAQGQIRDILEKECYRRLVMLHLRDLMEKAQVGSVENFYEAVYSRLPAYDSWKKKKERIKAAAAIEP